MAPHLPGKDSDIVCAAVINRACEPIGKVQDIAIHRRVAYLVLALHGANGAAGKLCVMPWKAMRYDNGRQAFMLDLSAEEIEQLPVFEDGNWGEVAGTEQVPPQINIGETPPF